MKKLTVVRSSTLFIFFSAIYLFSSVQAHALEIEPMRIEHTLTARGKEFPDWQRPVIAVILLLLSLGLAKFGIIALVARGYGLMSWGVFVIYFVPLVTVGLYKIIRQRSP